jgi:hypothetical protein
MRALIAVAAVVVMAGVTHAQETTVITPEMTATETRLLTKVGPQTRTWIKQEAAKQRTATGVPAISAESWKTLSPSASLTNTDIEALMFLVLMESAKSSKEDLKSTMAGVKATNAQKSSMREAQATKTVVADAQSVRLQAQMDRQAKMLQTMSSLMRKMAESGSTTVQNLK